MQISHILNLWRRFMLYIIHIAITYGSYFIKAYIRNFYITVKGTSPGRDRMVVGLTTTYVISAYHH